MNTTQIITKNAPSAIGPYSQGVKGNNIIFVSGQLPINPSTGKFATNEIIGQVKQSIENVAAILEAAGSSLKKVVKITIFIQHMDDFAAVNEVYATYFTGLCPARSCVEVAKLPKGALIEIEAIALT